MMFRVTTLDMKNPPKGADGAIDYTEDFFGKETNLTVSGQFNLPVAALVHTINITTAPSGGPNPVGSGGTVNMGVAANDTLSAQKLNDNFAALGGFVRDRV